MQISKQEVTLVKLLRSHRWLSAKDIFGATQLPGRTTRAMLVKLRRKEFVEVAPTFPPSYRLVEPRGDQKTLKDALKSYLAMVDKANAIYES